MPVSIEYYDVRGRDPVQLRREINAKGPEATGQWAIGLTWHHLKYSVRSRPSREGCRLYDAKVMTENKILIPRWVNEADADPRLRAEMHAIVKSTERHELERWASVRRSMVKRHEEFDAAERARKLREQPR